MELISIKTCTKCGEPKSLDQFSKHKGGRGLLKDDIDILVAAAEYLRSYKDE